MDKISIMIMYLVLFVLAFGLTYFVRQLALKRKIIDNPNERSSHTVPTPRGGGMAFVIVWFLGLGYLYWKGQIQHDLFYALLSGLVLAVVSLLDDIMDLRPLIRILAQSISALGALYFLGGFELLPAFHNPILYWFVNIGVFIGIIWFINLYNFLDGIDAYASQEAILVSAGILIVTGSISLGLLIATVGGFLFWNWPKAKIFMGDVGSTQLGFVLVVVGIYFHNLQEFNITNWLILTSLFWFDATLTLYRRWRNKEKLTEAHKKHAYQRIVQAGWSHQKTVIAAIIINVFLFGIVLITVWNNKLLIPAFLVCMLFLYLIVKFIDKKKAFD